MEYVAEHRRNSLRRQDQIRWPYARIVDQLRQDFPKYLRIDGAQHTQGSSGGHQFQQSKRAADIELP